MRKPIIVGNWKMHNTVPEAVELISRLKPLIGTVGDVGIGVAPPFTALWAVNREIQGTKIHLAGQDVFWENEGAYTGEISPRMLKDLGCRFVIIGHSERRQHFGESDESIHRKIKAALAEGLEPIVCVGESLEQRESGEAFSVVSAQVRRCFEGLSPRDVAAIIIAYEPIWAIGTGKTATPEQAEEMHKEIRGILEQIFDRETARSTRIQYGGSVNPDNIHMLMSQPDIDGALVGGASLRADSFSRIVKFGER